jgi:hypothetical protein
MNFANLFNHEGKEIMQSVLRARRQSTVVCSPSPPAKIDPKQPLAKKQVSAKSERLFLGVLAP